METLSNIGNRKNNHLEINIHQDVKSSNTTGLEKFRLIHSALPEIDLADVDASVNLFGRRLSYPLQISSMTGGTKRALKINRILAGAAETHGIAIGVGSQRIGIEDRSKMDSFRVREFAPNALIFANLGTVQLNYGFTSAKYNLAVEAIEADALIMHLNPLQEALMDNGNTNFSKLLKKIEDICKKSSVPVIVKEVGWGINCIVAKKLYDAGVSAIDVAGAGGTSWSEVEKIRAEDTIRKKVAEGFKGWGIPTADAIADIRKLEKNKLLFASGGILNGIDIIKCIALGADLCGIARPLLLRAVESEQSLNEYLSVVTRQIKVTMFAIGAQNISEISEDKITRI